MFGIFKSKQKDRLSARLKAVAEVRAHLIAAAAILTYVLNDINIECVHLGETPVSPSNTVALQMLDATMYREDEQLMELRLGWTDDHSTYSLEPHYRYLEICWLINDLATFQEVDRERYLSLARRHAGFSLIQTRILSFFLLRLIVTEDLVEAENMPEVQRELQNFAVTMKQLTAELPASLTRNLDLETTLRDWLGWPHVIGVRA